MIPMRVCVEGFMSYRDRAELSFDGPQLWALSGKNGAGKSAIFDAITFALYGVHRAGKSNKKSLINQQADNLVVEFDFRLGDTLYRAKRTLSRRGRGTYQISRIEWSSSSSSGKPKLLPESDTDTEKGFKAWVENQIGLDIDTFTASVLLQQGKSESMLEADPRIRHQMLSQIVDLSAYQSLYDKAYEKHKKLKEKAETFGDELKGLKPVDEAKIEQLTEAIKNATEESKVAQEQLRTLAALKVHAENWDKLVTEQTRIADALEKANALMAQAFQIEQDAKRLEELKKVLPQLEHLFKEQPRLAQSDELIVKHKAKAQEWAKKLEKAQGELTQAKNRLEDLKNQQEGWQAQKEEAQVTLLELAPQMGELKQLDDARDELNKLAKKLDDYPSDLDEQVECLKTEVGLLAELKNALPWLKQFAQARKTWRKAKLDEEEAKGELSELAERMSAVSTEHATLEGQVNEVEGQVGELQQKVTETETLLKQAQEQLKRFGQVEGKPTCNYCGQELTPEHLDMELKRLEGEYQIAKSKVDAAKEKHKEAIEQQEALVKALEGVVKQANGLEDDKRNADRKLEGAQQARGSAVSQAHSALENLPQTYQEQISQAAVVDIITCFELEYPTQTELEALSEKVTEYNDQKRQLDNAQQQVGQRNKLLAQLEPTQNRLRSLENKYLAKQTQEIRVAHQAMTERREKAEQELGKLNQPLRESEEELPIKDEAVRQAIEKQRQAAENAKAEAVRQQEMERTIANRIVELPEKWQTIADSLIEEQLKSWQEEAESLAGADERLEKLNEAKRDQKTREHRLSQIQQELDNIPPEAQCSLTELEEEEQTVRQKQGEADEKRQDIENQKRTLEERQERRCDLDKKQREATHKATLYKKLADLLGRDRLQRYLLQQAEVNIVAYANEMLDHISGGTLRLELQQSQNSDGKGSGKKVAKALDIVAYNSQVGQKPVLARLLSGSQRFRVAVSLALGIGRYMSQESRRIESVIIDEGFGGLDQDGRREMIDALHRLKDILGRIILVSHQEEFTRAFVNRYEITLEDGTSRAKPV